MVVSLPRVHWMRDVDAWVRCEGERAAASQCAPVGPADVLVASEMLSVRQVRRVLPTPSHATHPSVPLAHAPHFPKGQS